MNRKQIQNKLKDHTLSSHEREVLLQTLHYLTAEGLYSTSSSNNNSSSKGRIKDSSHKRSPKSSNYTRKNKRSNCTSSS